MQADNQRLINDLTKGIPKGKLQLIMASEGTGKSKVAPMSNSMSGPAVLPKRDILNDWRWKKGSEESKKTIEAIQNKASRAVPLFNKGGYQLATESDDPATLGKRR